MTRISSFQAAIQFFSDEWSKASIRLDISTAEAISLFKVYSQNHQSWPRLSYNSATQSLTIEKHTTWIHTSMVNFVTREIEAAVRSKVKNADASIDECVTFSDFTGDHVNSVGAAHRILRFVTPVGRRQNAALIHACVHSTPDQMFDDAEMWLAGHTISNAVVFVNVKEHKEYEMPAYEISQSRNDFQCEFEKVSKEIRALRASLKDHGAPIVIDSKTWVGRMSAEVRVFRLDDYGKVVCVAQKDISFSTKNDESQIVDLGIHVNDLIPCDFQDFESSPEMISFDLKTLHLRLPTAMEDTALFRFSEFQRRNMRYAAGELSQYGAMGK
ncbi:hypothetical protein V1517DRAFT_336288 [Lipomyces orientalis]|uniref:Uncharacterized protein n=1 Tax=Lipomyces orientalis TaxID=1233043 RepID=A0ACC3TVE9_9ASCO